MEKTEGQAQETAVGRQREIVRRIAEKAFALPLLDGGLWLYDDIRNNFYYASYLFAASVDETLPVTFDRQEAGQRALAVLREVLLLQNTDPNTPLYGHWPLGLAPVPREAKPNELPVEIMGSLMAVFRSRYGGRLDGNTAALLDAALGHVYRSGFFRKPLAHYHHHEAKYTAAKLIFGRLYADAELMADGHASLQALLAHMRQNGMAEYGILPWFWHWVQAFTAALELAGDDGRADGCGCAADLKAMLDKLWRIRAEVYLGGAWVGAHSRGWPHDVPRDGNVLHDYVQFGGFPLPDDMPRTEYAGLLHYPAPQDAVKTALDRSVPVEVKKRIVPISGQGPWHSYAYICEQFAAGGLWERVDEFDNEQLRWAFTLPVRADGSVNRLYFFHPGRGYREGDPRHQSGRMEVLYDRRVVAAWFKGPDESDSCDYAVGVLPEGSWLERPNALFGRCDGALFAVFLSGGHILTERDGYREARLAALPGGVVVEAISEREAAARGIADLAAFAAEMEGRAPKFAPAPQAAQAGALAKPADEEDAGSCKPAAATHAADQPIGAAALSAPVIRYRSLQGGELALALAEGAGGAAAAFLDGKPMIREGYTV